MDAHSFHMRSIIRSLLIGLSLSFLLQSIHVASAQSLDENKEWITLADIDLEPISLGIHEKKIRAALKAKDWSYAARLLKVTSPPLQFLKAWFHVQADQWENALQLLKGLEDHPLLADEVNALLCQAYLY